MKGEIKIVDFKQDLKKTTTAFLDYYGVKYKKKDTLQTLLIKLYTFFEKYVVPQKRHVCYSQELICKKQTLPKEVQQALFNMEKWIEDGVDINCFQGRGLYGTGSRDYQNSLYRIVHLHLSAREQDRFPVTKGRFAKPGKYLLFVLFKNEIAFFLDVIPHPQPLNKDAPPATEWTSSNWIKIMENNWPKLLEKAKVPIDFLCDGSGNKIELNDRDIAELTSNHINTIVSGNQGNYLLGLGVSGSGDSTYAVMSAHKSVNYATQCELLYKEKKDEIHAALRNILLDAGHAVPKEFDIHFDFVPDFGTSVLLDRISGAGIDFGTKQLFIV